LARVHRNWLKPLLHMGCGQKASKPLSGKAFREFCIMDSSQNGRSHRVSEGFRGGGLKSLSQIGRGLEACGIPEKGEGCQGEMRPRFGSVPHPSQNCCSLPVNTNLLLQFLISSFFLFTFFVYIILTPAGLEGWRNLAIAAVPQLVDPLRDGGTGIVETPQL